MAELTTVYPHPPRPGRSLIARVSSSPINYWATLVTDALAAVAFGVLAAMQYSGSVLAVPLLVIAGFFLWGLFEYALHRWILHGMLTAPRREHARHHGDPEAPVSTPVMVMPILAVILWGALALVTSAGISAVLIFGVYAGYNYYAVVHHLQHHWPSALERSRFFGYRLHVHRIHHRDPGVDFGISSSLWDRVFGTFQGR